MCQEDDAGTLLGFVLGRRVDQDVVEIDLVAVAPARRREGVGRAVLEELIAVERDGGVVEFRYDAQGNRVLLQDPVGNITTWVYDELNRVVEERDPFYWVDITEANAEVDPNIWTTSAPRLDRKCQAF